MLPGVKKIELSDSAANLIAKIADGAMRDALSVLDRCINGSDTVTLETVENTVGICSYDELSSAITAIADNDTAAALEFYSRCRRNSKDAVALFSELCSCFRDMIIVKLVKDAGTFLSVDDRRLAEISALADRFELEKKWCAACHCFKTVSMKFQDIKTSILWRSLR